MEQLYVVQCRYIVANGVVEDMSRLGLQTLSRHSCFFGEAKATCAGVCSQRVPRRHVQLQLQALGQQIDGDLDIVCDRDFEDRFELLDCRELRRDDWITDQEELM